jgi:predicted exporter
VSQFLPTQQEVEQVEEWSSRLPELLTRLELAFVEAGYQADAFDRFFADARASLEENAFAVERVEALLEEFSERLRGPMESVLGRFGDRAWSLTSASIAPSEALPVLEGVEDSFLFSQLSFLNRALGKHRAELLNIGVWAALLVAAVMLVAFGLKRGALIVLYPSLGGGIAVGLCSLFFGQLNLFHLVGCFLGGAIALDYALFATEAYRRGVAMPRSVWLSAGTTTASFLALGFSSVAVVQSLGWLVALLACVTLLLLHCSQPFLGRFLQEDGSENAR